MVANTLLEVYTLIFGWNLYTAIWDILTGTGLALIPFIVSIVTTFRDNYVRGNARSAIQAMEGNIIGMVIVIMLCVIPYKGWDTELATVRYNLDVPDCHLRAEPLADNSGTGGDTTTAYNDSFAGMGGMGVYQPIAWAMVSFISTAITHTTINSIACVNNYELMLLRVSQVTVQDTDLRERIRNFYENCYKKALARFEINPQVLLNVSEVDDIDWMGSRILLNQFDEYYQHQEAYMEDMESYGFQRQVVTRDSDAANETGANPYCNEVWSGEVGAGIVNPAPGLRELILLDISEDQVGNILDDWLDWGSDVLTVGVAALPTKEDLLIKMILEAEAANLKSKTNVDLSNNFSANTSKVAELIRVVTTFSTTFDEFLRVNAMMQMIKIAGPMLLALVQMIIIMASPIVMVLGNYRMAPFVALGLAYFSFEFINAIWAMSFWFDQKILDIYMSQAGYIDIATNSFLISAVSIGSIILLPGVWLSILAYSGAGMVRGMGIGGTGGGTALGSNTFRSASSRMGGSALKRVKNRK